MNNPSPDVVVDALAVYRLTRLVQEDTLTEPAREAVALVLGESRWSELLHCPWCLSVWLAGGVVLARRVFPRAWPAVARVLAYSAVTGLLTER